MRILVWNEFRHERNENHPASRIYPEGLHAPILDALQSAGLEAEAATLDEPEQGLPASKLAAADVLIWWGHAAHAEVAEALVDRLQQRVLDGMGLVCLHSAHYSKIFKRLMGTSCSLKWREAGERERLWVVDRSHPIAEGLDEHFVLEHEEMYGETFDIPAPDELVFVSWFAGGEVFRSGCCWRRGRGRIFYFRPGHETYPTYYDPNVRRVIVNGALWAGAPHGPRPIYDRRPPLEGAAPRRPESGA